MNLAPIAFGVDTIDFNNACARYAAAVGGGGEVSDLRYMFKPWLVIRSDHGLSVIRYAS